MSQFVRVGKTILNLERVTFIEEAETEAETDNGNPFIRFNFGSEEAVAFFKRHWQGHETEEYPMVKAWLDACPFIETMGGPAC